MKKLPSSLIVAFWLTGGLWLVMVGHSYWHLPPLVTGCTALMAIVVALTEWLSGSEPPR